MSLGTKQKEFTRCLSQLYNYIHFKGWEFTLGDGYRDPRVFSEFGKVGPMPTYSSIHSVHKLRLAQDINLFVGDEYIIDGQHLAYKELGKYWESLHPDARWGGNFASRDSNHFSFNYRGFA